MHNPICIALAALFSGLTGFSTPAHAGGLDLRDQFTEYSKSADQKRWQMEDRIVQRERQFQDGLQEEFRDVELKAQDDVKAASNWRDAKRAYRDRIRAEISQLRQKIRVHRDEFDLSFTAGCTELEQDMKNFLSPLEAEFKKNSGDPSYQKAQDDFSSSKDDLREDMRKWKDRVRDLKTPESLFSF